MFQQHRLDEFFDDVLVVWVEVFGGSEGEFEVIGGACGGRNADGSFNGTVMVFSGIGFGGGLLPVDASVSETYSWAFILSAARSRPNPRRNPDGSFMSGGVNECISASGLPDTVVCG